VYEIDYVLEILLVRIGDNESFFVVGVYVGNPAIRMFKPPGKVAEMFSGVMSIGSSGRRLSHWLIAVSGSCRGCCWCNCVSLC
jgi:hypothetical protein